MTRRADLLRRTDREGVRAPPPRVRGLTFAVAVSAACAVTAHAAAAPPMPAVEAVVDALDRVREFRDVAIAPDGRRVAFTEKVPEGDGLGRVFVADLPAGTPRRVTAGPGAPLRERAPAFSPDGRQLAFLSDAVQAGQLQLHVAPAAGGAPRQVTHASGQLAEPKWSPDGRSLALLYVAGSEHETGALAAHPRDAGVVADPVETQRIAIVDVASGELREVSPQGLYVYDYDWSPDGRRFAAEAVYGSGTNDYWIAELFVIDAASGRAQALWKPPLQIASPRFAPDGASIAVIHGLMSDEGSNGGDVYLVPLGGGTPRNLTPDLAASAKSLHWTAAGAVIFNAHADGGFGVGRVSAGAASEWLWTGDESVAPLAVATDGASVAAVRHAFARPPEVWAGAVGQWRQVSRLNDGAPTWWGEARKLHWTSDGRRVQGWLLPPRHVAPGRRYPLVAVVHGGPAGTHAAAWPSRWAALLPSQGYFVLLPNPRGSLGFGAEFTQANVKDFGYGDLRDILAGVDAAARLPEVDGERAAVVGWSYGGYMSMWAPTQTGRFKAAVAGAGIANWQSYYGQNRIDRWMIPFFGASVYDDPEVYARSSPITFIKRHKTPTLVLHGERDAEVPAPQGYELWKALETLGVPVQLVVYPDEGHRITRREHRLDIQQRTVEWLERHLR